MTPSAPKSDALRALYWRSEILRVVYWLYGEGLSDVVDVGLIRRYLGVDAHEDLATFLDHLVVEGSLVRDGDWYALSARGRVEGEVELATAFSDLVHPVPGECDEECWCHMSVAEAEACAGQRAGRPPAQGDAATRAHETASDGRVRKGPPMIEHRTK